MHHTETAPSHRRLYDCIQTQPFSPGYTHHKKTKILKQYRQWNMRIELIPGRNVRVYKVQWLQDKLERHLILSISWGGMLYFSLKLLYLLSSYFSFRLRGSNVKKKKTIKKTLWHLNLVLGQKYKNLLTKALIKRVVAFQSLKAQLD